MKVLSKISIVCYGTIEMLHTSLIRLHFFILQRILRELHQISYSLGRDLYTAVDMIGSYDSPTLTKCYNYSL